MAFAASSARADDYPSRPINLICPYAAGGATDLTVRVLAQALSKEIGQSVIVENRVGANTVIGTQAVAAARPDGYTLLMQTISFAVNASLVKKLPYDTNTAFKPVALVAINPLVLVVNPKVPAKTLPEFIQYLKDNPNTPYSSSGTGGAMHLAAELFEIDSGTKALHVPYRGESPAVNDLLAGTVSFTFGSFAVMGENFKAGTLRPIAVLGPKRSPLAPDLPTAIEAGLPDYTAYTWNAVLAPAGVPDAVVAKLNAAINRAMSDPAVIRKLSDMGFGPVSDSTPASTAAYIKDEIAKWKAVVDKAHIQIE